MVVFATALVAHTAGCKKESEPFSIVVHDGKSAVELPERGGVIVFFEQPEARERVRKLMPKGAASLRLPIGPEGPCPLDCSVLPKDRAERVTQILFYRPGALDIQSRLKPPASSGE